MDGDARRPVAEDDVAPTAVVGIAPEGPEVALVEFARALASRLDRGLIHRLDPAGTDTRELGGDDGGEQQRHGEHLLGQPLAADGDPGGQQALVLAIQRQVVEELVDDQAGEEAHVGPPALKHAGRRRCTMQGGVVRALDDRTDVFQDDVAARALGEAVGDFLADDFIGVGGQPGGLGVRQGNHFDRYLCGIEEQRGLLAVAARGAAAGVGRHRLGRRRVWGGTGQPLAQGQLLGRRIKVAALGLLTKDLALQPGQLVLQLGDPRLQLLTKRPRSSRLAHRQKPVRSQYRALR